MKSISGLVPSVLLVVSMAALAPLSAQTTDITINNPSFETPVTGYNSYIHATVPDYSSSNGVSSGTEGFPGDTVNYNGDAGGINQTGQQGGTNATPDGNQSATINGDATLYQITSAPLVLGDTYTFTAYIGNRADYGSNTPGGLSLAAAPSSTSGFGDLVQLSTTGDVLPALTEFEQYSTSFTVNDPSLVGDFITVEFYSTGVQASFDDLALTQTVPEPSVYALLFTGLGLLFFIRLRHRLS